MGLSEPSSTIQQLFQYTKILKKILDKENIQGPLILVGHSLGGSIMLDYALKHPQEVAGIILVDASHEKQVAHSQSKVKKYVKLIKMMLLLSWLGIPSILSYMRIRNKAFSMQIIKQYRCLQSTRKSIRTFLSEINEYARGFKTFTNGLQPPLKNVPLVVITRGEIKNKKVNKKLDTLQKGLQKDFLDMSTNSRHIIANNSGHFVQWTEPGLIIDAVRWIQAEHKKNHCRT